MDDKTEELLWSLINDSSREDTSTNGETKQNAIDNNSTNLITTKYKQIDTYITNTKAASKIHVN